MAKRILCTLGPASLDARTIRRLTELKVDLFRLNLSHTDPARLEEWVALIRTHSDIPICFDTQGAQVRTGTFAGREVLLEADITVEMAPAPAEGTARLVPLYPASVIPQLAIGDLVSLDFHSAVLQVIEVGDRCRARVLCAGVVGSNKAASIDRVLALPPLTEVDRAAMAIARRLGIRHVALSFANRREDVELLRTLVGPDVTVIAKVESRQALANLDDILAVADEVLIDRGDLSREVPIERVPLIQKDVIRRANLAGVPVNVATNLLESMVQSQRPTRAEVNDVINTLIDGADGLVLAAETAIGRHPIGCVGMIRALIEQYEQQAGGSAPSARLAATWLVAPHGGQLVQRALESIDQAAVAALPVLDLDERVAMDVRQIAFGAFSPLQGFMDRAALASVLATNRLPDGTVWPLPVVLQIPAGMVVSDVPRSGTVGLAVNGETYAALHVQECFQWDLRDLAMRWFGTDSTNHPGVAHLVGGTDHFLAGEVDLLPGAALRRQAFELTPAQARTIFEHRHWHKIVGFHTRNVPHRAHEHLQLTALAEYHCDGVFVHPVVGPKKSGDCAGEVILKSYQLLIAKHYPPNSAMVAGFVTYSRYAGPREALFTAICRQNFGCSHFIVGRDHTGVGTFYSPDASQRLFEALAGDLVIEPIFYDEVYYCQRCQRHLGDCAHGRAHSQRLSGTEAREMLKQGAAPPDWFMRDSVSRLILDEMAGGTKVFVA